MTTATNPILPGFYPDPSICRVDDNYYLVNSSFCFMPGLPLFHSKDLCHWKQITNIIDRPSQLPLTEGCDVSRGIFAPSIRYNNGTYYLITTNVDAGGNFIMTAKNPEGPWSEPHFLGDTAPGYDPDLFFDDDGKCYVLGTRENPEGWRYNGDMQIWVNEIDINTFELIGEKFVIWNGAMKIAIWPEGPHLFKRNGYYYLIYAEGGTSDDHAICVARSKNLHEWFEGCLKNPIFTHRMLGKKFPIQNVGHADVVTDPDGNYYCVLLASRMIKGPDERMYSSLGRETFLAKIIWEEDWPVINEGLGMLSDTVDIPLTPVVPDTFMSERKDFNLDDSSLIDSLEFITFKDRDFFIAGLRQQSYTSTITANEGSDLCKAFKSAYGKEAKGVCIFQNSEHKLLIPFEKNKNIYVEIHDLVADIYTTSGTNHIIMEEGIDLSPYTTEIAGGFVGCILGLYY